MTGDYNIRRGCGASVCNCTGACMRPPLNTNQVWEWTKDYQPKIENGYIIIQPVAKGYQCGSCGAKFEFGQTYGFVCGSTVCPMGAGPTICNTTNTAGTDGNNTLTITSVTGQ